jgi:Domain of unknown function (DUF4276)
MRDDTVHFGFVVEGKGEIGAIPLLIRRICHEILGVFALQTTSPVRITRSRLVRRHELERAMRLVRLRTTGPILVVLDADEDCPAKLGAILKSRSLAIAGADEVSVVIPKFEFETWFLAAAQSLSGKRGLRPGLVPPPDPEAIRGAKEWLSRNMVPGRKYSPSIDQVALVAGMDLVAARSCGSFDRLCREIERLVRVG